MNVAIVEKSIVLNAGNMMQKWTIDLLKSTPHREKNTEMKKSRFSRPYFVDPVWDFIIDNLTDQTDNFPSISTN